MCPLLSFRVAAQNDALPCRRACVLRTSAMAHFNQETEQLMFMSHQDLDSHVHFWTRQYFGGVEEILEVVDTFILFLCGISLDVKFVSTL